jgi:hypothetical protein
LNCGLFNHIAKHCRAKTICRKCSGDHRTETCQSTTSRCSNCKGNHPSWATICKIKQAAKIKAKAFQALITRKWENTITSQPSDQQEEWTTISNPRKRRNQTSGNQDTAIRAQSSVRKPPGRPTGTTDIRKAGTHPGQNKLSFPQPQNLNGDPKTGNLQEEQRQDTEMEEDGSPQETILQQTSHE